ncbi:uncharacterized protein LOC144129587 [Amblyomma americanum]
MPGCCVPLCAGSAKKGARCFRFPRDEGRRKIWEAKVKRENWKANDNAKICERHFEEDQFEGNRMDGRRLLKSTAVPTMFDFRPEPKRRKPPAPRLFPGSSTPDATKGSSPTPETTPDQEETLAMPENTREDSGEQIDIFSLSTSELRKKLQDEKRKRSQLEESLLQANKKLEKAAKRTKQLEENLTTLTANLSLLNQDQKAALEKKNRKNCSWGANTIKKALQLKFACGSAGYDLLLEQGQPLPSRRTLCRRLQHLTFLPGVLTEILTLMEAKVAAMSEIERDCVLFLDELEIRRGVELDRSSDCFLGKTTLPESDQPANHALVFMIGGLNTRWKQVIAYHYAGMQPEAASSG